MTNIEKLRILIKRQIRYEELNFADLGGGGQTMNIGAFEWVLKQLDTLEEPVSVPPTDVSVPVQDVSVPPVCEELEEACRKECREYINQMMPDTMEAVSLHFTKFGANWQKDQMMKEAIGGNAYPNDGEIWVDLARYGYKFKEGEPCRIIIVKED